MNNPQNNIFPSNDNIDKTFVEGSIDHTQHEMLPQNNQQSPPSQAQNPYAQRTLPTGKDPVQVGSGTIVSVLGTGGMAKVYKIWNQQLEVFRAVKILLPTGQADLSKRFETEAKITAKLHHTNIVEIYNVGEWNGLPYLEMELVEGVGLDTLISKYGNLPDAICCSVGIQIAKALSYAHSMEFLLYGKSYKGIIHRDLKPANIMISKNGDLKLMDFGIARPTEAGLHTMDGHIVGTLQYLSPEQLDGIAIDSRADLYSLGAIFYEIITGTKTFPQSTITNLMRMKATNKYRKFSEFKLNTSPILTKIAERCLLIDRSQRFDDANDLIQELKRAYVTISNDSPTDVLLNYLKNPEEFINNFKPQRKIPPKLLYIASGIAGVIGIILILVSFLSNGDETQKDRTQIAKPKEITPAQVIKDSTPMTTKPEVPVKPVVKAPVSRVKAPVTRAKTPVRKPKPTIRKPVKKPAPTPKVLSAFEKLQKKYGVTNPVTIGEKACKKGNFSDAIKVLEGTSVNNPKKSLYLSWAYVEKGQIAKANKITKSISNNDAFIELLKGRIQATLGKTRKAINHYNTALTKPSTIKNSGLIRKDALYYIALVYDSNYSQSPSSNTRIQALTAWNNLKKVYSSQSKHPRFKLANKKLSTIN